MSIMTITGLDGLLS